jgi:hypothetical protein
MAKVKHPSYMPESNGRAGDAVFYVRRGKQCMRTYVIPANPDTEKQKVTRNSFKDAVKAWQLLSNDEKNIFRKRTDDLDLSMTGYNLFISEYINQSGEFNPQE